MIVPIIPHIIRVKIRNFLDFFLVGKKLAIPAQSQHQVTTLIPLQMRHYTLLMARGVHLQRQLAIQPDATFTLVSITMATDRCMVKPIELRIPHIQSIVQTFHRISVFRKIEGGTYIEVAIWCQGNAGIPRPTELFIPSSIIRSVSKLSCGDLPST